MDTTVYKERAERFSQTGNQFQQKLSWLSFFRLLLFVLFIYLLYRSTQTGAGGTIAAAIAAFAAFIAVVKWYERLQQKLRYYRALAKYNTDELLFLDTNRSAYPDGKEYEDPHHPYSYDLDLFGTGGLYAYLNRCSTAFGRKELAGLLLSPDTATIKERQLAVKELSALNDFRQQLYAKGSLQETREKDLNQLLDWIHTKGTTFSKPLYFFLMLFPLVTVGSLLYYFFVSDSNEVFRIIYSLIIVNLIIAFAFSKKIAAQLSVSSSVNKILIAYKDQLQLIEEQSFQTPLLQNLQQQLKKGPQQASAQLHRLARHDSGDGMAVLHAVGIHDPRHDLRIGAHVRCWDIAVRADDDADLGGIAPRQALELGLRQRSRVDHDAALCPAERQVDDRAFPRHKQRQRPYFIQRDAQAEAKASLHGAPRVVVLHAVAGEDARTAVIHRDRAIHR